MQGIYRVVFRAEQYTVGRLAPWVMLAVLLVRRLFDTCRGYRRHGAKVEAQNTKEGNPVRGPCRDIFCKIKDNGTPRTPHFVLSALRDLPESRVATPMTETL